MLKTDAIDHAAGHDLIGCQDIAWDVVGAETELALTADEMARLLDRMRWQGTAVERPLVALLRPAYLAFQWASFAMAADHGGGAAPAADRAALAAERDRYRAALQSAFTRADAGGTAG